MFLDFEDGGCVVSDNPTKEDLTKAGMCEHDAALVLDIIKKARARNVALSKEEPE